MEKKNKIKPPSFPWKKGHNECYSCFSLEVKICQERTGEVWSLHDFLSEEDSKISSEIYSGGVEQIVYGLFTEAVRREAFLEALVIESQVGGCFQDFKNEETREQAREKLKESVLKVSRSLLDKIVEGAVTEILTMLTKD